ncbi:MAG: hypothetical protein V3T31_00695 [candidate division Zixibacteria bacterium]
MLERVPHCGQLLGGMMSQLHWKEVFEMVGLSAIVASLIFVGIQLRQDQIIARSELTSESMGLMIELSQSLKDPAFAKTYAKMLNNPNDLSIEEMVQLDSLLEQVTRNYGRECYLVSRGIFVECAAIVRNTVELYFGNPHAQSWWRLNGPGKRLPDWIDTEIKNVDTDYYRRRLEDTKAGIQ